MPKGFTLIELMLTIAVIGILSGITITVLNNANYRAEAGRSVARARVQGLAAAIQDFRTSEGRLPTDSPPADRVVTATEEPALYVYLKAWPVAPDNTNIRYYTDGTNYGLMANVGTNNCVMYCSVGSVITNITVNTCTSITVAAGVCTAL